MIYLGYIYTPNIKCTVHHHDIYSGVLYTTWYLAHSHTRIWNISRVLLWYSRVTPAVRVTVSHQYLPLVDWLGSVLHGKLYQLPQHKTPLLGGYIHVCGEAQTTVAMLPLNCSFFVIAGAPNATPSSFRPQDRWGGYHDALLPLPTATIRTPTEQENQSRKTAANRNIF